MSTEFLMSNLIPTELHNRIRPIGFQYLRLYGLPDVHRKNEPLRHILCMRGSILHQISKLLAEIFRLVSDSYFTYCFSDPFKFSNFIRNYEICSNNNLVISFNIVNLYPNVPSSVTLQLYTDALYRGHLGPQVFSEAFFIEYIHLATGEVEFRFDEIMYGLNRYYSVLTRQGETIGRKTQTQLVKRVMHITVRS